MAARPDVEATGIGLLGVSMGGEVALRVAARRPNVRATVAEGVMGGGAGDASIAGASLPVVAQLAVMSALSTVLTGESSEPDTELVERIAPRPLMLISAGRETEANLNRVLVRRGGASTEHWNLPDAAHAVAHKTDPDGYERRVIAFLDRAVSPEQPRHR